MINYKDVKNAIEIQFKFKLLHEERKAVIVE